MALGTHFRITGLPVEPFAPLFDLPDDALAAHRAVRVTADSNTGFPCRISLTNAAVGDRVLLVHYEHHPVDTPFRASHAIYVRPGEVTYDAVDQIPEQLRTSLLSVRAFDRTGMLVDADVVPGTDLEGVIGRLFAESRTDYLHVHFARPGCYAARVERA